MAQKTIKISSLPQGTTSQQVRSAFQNESVVRIHIIKNKAYVQFQTSDDIDTLEFVYPNNRIEKLNDAQFDRVQSNFKWDSISSDSSSVQQLKQERDFPQKNEQHINLTQPSPQNLITISNCDENTLKNLSQFGIKKNIFGGFHSLNRVLKRGRQVIIQLEDPAQAQKLQSIFPNLKVHELGSNAYIDLQAETVNNFAAQWIQQHHKQNQIKSEITQFNPNQPQKKEQQQPKRYLHEDIIPKLNKMTSMETDFLSSQQSSKVNQEQHHHHIPEQSQEHIQTKNELPKEEDGIGFIMEEPVQTGQDDYLLRQAYQRQQAQLKAEQQKKRQEQFNQKRIQQQRKRQQQQKKQQQRRRQQQNHRRQLEQQRKRQQDQRRKQQQQTRRRQLEQQRKKQQQKRHEEQRRRKQQEQHSRKQQEKRKQQQQQRKKQEQLVKKQKQQQARQAQQKKEQEEKKMLQMQIKRQRELQEEERKRKAQDQQRLEKQKTRAQQQRLDQQRREEQRKRMQYEIMNRGSELVGGAVTAGRQVAQKLMGSQQTSRLQAHLRNSTKTPIAFWALIMVAMLAMLLF